MGERDPRRDPCPVGECGDVRAPDQLMCRFHWFKVPKPIRDRVWKHYRARRAATAASRADRAAIKLHAEACRDAIAAAETAEAR